MESDYDFLEKIIVIHGFLKSKVHMQLIKDLKEKRQGLVETRFPVVDIFVSTDKIKIYAELPGIALDDFTAFLLGEFLIIEGEKKLEKIPYKVNFIRMERIQAEFRRVITLPYKIKKENIVARLKNGILFVELHIDK